MRRPLSFCTLIFDLGFCSYAMDVNVERAEDVLTHKRLLELAKDPAQRPAFAVRAVQVRAAPPPHTTAGLSVAT
jgi:hypothetical protein